MMGWISAACALLAFLLYYNTLDAGFVYDDRRAILSNPDVIGHTPIEALFENDFWGTPLTDAGSHGSYRPLSVATFRLNYALSGFKPWSYHLFNVILHSLATTLVVSTAWRLFPDYCTKVGTAVTGVVFAAHPIHTEAVASVVGRADLAACVFFLLSFLTYTMHIPLREESKKRQLCQHTKKNVVRRQIPTSEAPFRLSCHALVEHIMTNFRKLLKAGKVGPMKVINACEVKPDAKRRQCEDSDSVSEDYSELLQWLTLAGTLLFAVAATLCKEPGIMVLPLCILYDFLKGGRQEEPYSKSRWRSVCALIIGGVALLQWRLHISGMPKAFAAADNPASRDPSLLARFFTFSYLPVFNFFLFLYPIHLSFDWSMDSIPRITTLLDPRNIATAVFYAVLANVTWQALVKEYRMRQEGKPIKEKRNNNKIQKHKPKQKWSANNKHHNRGPDNAGRKNSRSLPTANKTSNKKAVCPTNGCNRALTDEHTSACRAVNNNNTMMHNSTCVCPKVTIEDLNRVRRNPRVALLTSVAFMVLPFVPASNLLFYVGFVVAERVLYIPSVGLCLLVGLGAGALTRGWRGGELRTRLAAMALAAALAGSCAHTARRALDWRDEETLFRSAVHINPPKAYGNLGSILTAQGRTAEAEDAFEKALQHRPNMADVHYNLGILFQNQRRYGEAIRSFERAISFRPSMALAYVNLGASLMADGRIGAAANALRAGARAEGVRVRDRREHDAARVSALVQLASLHTQKGQWQNALAAYQEALQILPESNAPIVGWTRHSVLSMTSEVQVQLQQYQQAEHSVLAAMMLMPNHVKSHVSLARILARNATRLVEAEMWLKKAVALAPNDASVRDQLGLFFRTQGRLRECAVQMVKAARLSPDDSARAAAAARALRDANHCESAEQWYARAVQLSPDDAEHLSNLGAILHLNGKYSAAASSYRKALKLQPGDEITMTNLNRVRALMAQEKKNGRAYQ